MEIFDGIKSPQNLNGMKLETKHKIKSRRKHKVVLLKEERALER